MTTDTKEGGEKEHKEQPAVDAHTENEGGFSFTYLQGLIFAIVVLMVLMWLARRGGDNSAIKEKSVV